MSPFKQTVLLVLTFAVTIQTGFAQRISLTALYERLSPSVVTIIVYDRSARQIRSGSGVIISGDGVILTNHHVVEGGIFFDVRIADQSKTAQLLPARPTGARKEQDLATVRIAPPFALKPARIGGVLPKVGSKVYAIGSPFELEGSLSEGIVSQIRTDGDRVLIQTTAPISPGSSGGALFSDTGELVGITTLSIRSGQGLNFAVSCLGISGLVPVDSFPTTTVESASRTPPSIFIAGIQAILGMSQNEFMSMLSSNVKLMQYSSTPGWFAISHKVGNYYHSVGTVTFQDGKLVRVSRDWNEGSSSTATQAIVDILTQNAGEGPVTTVLRTRTERTPNGRLDSAKLTLEDGRKLDISILTSQDGVIVSVNEIIEAE